MRKSIACILGIFAIIGAKPVDAMEELQQYVPQASVVGEARMSVMFWDVYDAKLLAPNGKWSGDKPFALQLRYLRDIDGSKIADRAVQEMRKQGVSDEVKLATWHNQMIQIFPDVHEGDTLTGIFTENDQTIFLNESKEIGRINNVEFTKHFSAIWLSPRSSAQDVRLGLLGHKTLKGKNNHEIMERTGSRGTNSLY